MVEDTFTIEGRGLALVGFARDQCDCFRIGDRVDLVRPDGSVIRAEIVGVEHPASVKWIGKPPRNPRYGIVVSPGIRKEQVPVGTEVWSVDE
jgi:hypothetical protein